MDPGGLWAVRNEKGCEGKSVPFLSGGGGLAKERERKREARVGRLTSGVCSALQGRVVGYVGFTPEMEVQPAAFRCVPSAKGGTDAALASCCSTRSWLAQTSSSCRPSTHPPFLSPACEWCLSCPLTLAPGMSRVACLRCTRSGTEPSRWCTRRAG
eukprot:292139-Rhodomonas_salina.1